MESRKDKTQVSEKDIAASQKLMSSAGLILRRCLRFEPRESTNCHGLYEDFESQKQILQSQEKQYLASHESSLKSKTEQFDKAFGPCFAPLPPPVEQLSPESQALKKDIIKHTAEFLETKREFESFRNKTLKKTAHRDPNYSSAGFLRHWPRKFANEDINTLLKMELQQSDEVLKNIDKRMSDNEKAQYVSITEISNDLRSGKLKI